MACKEQVHFFFFFFLGKKLNPLILIAKPKVIMKANQRMHVKEQMSTRSSEVNKQDQWCPPPIGHYKVNIDTVVHKKQYIIGLVVVIQDS